MFYWVTIMFSQTLGTALGDYVASEDGLGLGYLVSAAVFGGAMVILALLYYGTKVSRTILFWIAFVLTRPLGAVVGDFLDKPTEDGGLELSRYTATAILLVLIVAAIFIFPQKPAEKRTNGWNPLSGELQHENKSDSSCEHECTYDGNVLAGDRRKKRKVI